MTLRIRPIAHNFLLLHLIVAFITSSNSYAQQRSNEEMPKLSGSVKSITILTGWKRNDIGKWKQAFNGIPFGEQTLKIDIAKIKYDGKEHYCFAKFSKHFYYRLNKRQVEYFADIWMFDIDTVENLKYSDTSVHTLIYNNIVVSHVLGGSQPVTWNNVLIQMKKCFINTYPNDTYLSPIFFIKYRYDNKASKAQFYFGSLGDYSKNIDDNTYEDFTSSEPCYDKDKNQNLNCCYFETTKGMFEKNLQNILQENK